MRGAQIPPGLATSPNVQEADEFVLDKLTTLPDFPCDDSELSDDDSELSDEDTGSDSTAQSSLPQRSE